MKCINRYDKKLMLSKCEGAPSISLTWRKEFIFDKDSQACLDVGSISKHDRKPIPTFDFCHKMGGNQFWKYELKTRTIEQKRINQCLATDGALIYLKNCNLTDVSQQWVFDDSDMSQYRKDLFPFERRQ